ncbi:MAG: caspase family protein, partial [Chloroflexi bacterium]|nr:caspase family protein [Chloroflexota bacterium]
MAGKFALIIVNSEYEDTNLARLVKPAADVNALSALLRDSEIGAFDEVMTLVNEVSTAIRRAIARFFAQKTADDLLLLYFSGHGVLDDRGELFLAAKDTERDLISGTAIPAAYITGEMDRS